MTDSGAHQTTHFPHLDNAYDGLRFAEETHAMALGNFDNVWPWRWLRWFRQHRLIYRRLAWQKSERARRATNKPW